MKPYEKYKDSGVEWIGKVPEHWEDFRLKTLIPNVIAGVWGDEEKKDENDIICIRVADFDMDALGVSLENLTTRNIEPKQLSSRLLIGGELLIEKSGGGEKQTVGRVIQNTLKNRAVCSNFVATLKNKPSIDNRFLVYVFHALYSNRINTKSIKQTTGIQNLDLDDYLQERVFLPKSVEQTAIARYLDQKTTEIDQLIAQKERLRALWEEEKTALINQAVTRGLDAGAKMKDSGVAWLGEVPEGWEVKRLKYVFELITDKSELDLPKVGLENIESKTGNFIQSNTEFEGEGIDFKVNDILFGKLRPYLVKVYLAEFNGKAVGDFFVYRTKSRILPAFGRYLMLSSNFIQIVNSSTFGSKMPRVSSEFLADLFIFYPPSIPEQTAIVHHIETQTARIQTQMDQTRKLIELLREYRATLISEVVTGKVKITA